MGKAKAARIRPIEDGRGDRAGLSDEGEITRLRRELGEACVDTATGRDEAQAIGSNHAQKVGLCRRKEVASQPFARDALALAETSGDNDGRAAAALTELGDKSRYRLRGRCDDSEFGRDG